MYNMCMHHVQYTVYIIIIMYSIQYTLLYIIPQRGLPTSLRWCAIFAHHHTNVLYQLLYRTKSKTCGWFLRLICLLDCFYQWPALVRQLLPGPIRETGLMMGCNKSTIMLCNILSDISIVISGWLVTKHTLIYISRK